MLIEITLILVFGFVFWVYFVKNEENASMPTVPWAFPLLGHIPYFGGNPAKKLMEWKNTYGPIFSFRMGSFQAIVINDTKMIKEAFSLPALCGRPNFPNFVLISNKKGLFFSDEPGQIEQKAFAVKFFREFGVGTSKLEFMFQEEISIFIRNFRLKQMQGKKEVLVTIKHFFQFPVINSLWGIIMGKRFDEGEAHLDTFISHLSKILDLGSNVIATLTWFFPWCSKLLHKFELNPTVNLWRIIEGYMNDQIEQTRKDHVFGEPKHFTHAYLDKIEKTIDPLSSFHKLERQQATTTTELFAGAVDTTTTTLDVLFLYMARELEIQRKLQNEIDSIIGPKVMITPLPGFGSESESYCPVTLAHRRHMPYTEALIHELNRIACVAHFGHHRSLDDVNFHGYKIPKNTIVLSNNYGAHFDPELWENPEKFRPERFLDKDGKLNNRSSELIAFGTGKRMCIGEGFAQNQLFIFIACFFHKFSVFAADKNKIHSVNINFGVVSCPDTFDVVIREREIYDL